jgi:hypothetical protein
MMKTRFFRQIVAPLALVASAAIAQGCFGPPYVEGAVGIEVGSGPPGVRTEVRIAAPGDGYYWVPGYYDWNGNDWYWVSGVWQRPPHDHARWVEPRYQHHRGHWQYYRGHWN